MIIIKKQNKKYKEYNKEENGINYRKCQDCEKWFELNDQNFNIQPKTKGGFSKRCSGCQTKYNHEYYMSTRDIQIANAAKWQKENYARHRELHKKYERTEKHKEYRKRNHEDMKNKGWFNNWYKNHPDRAKEYRKNHRNHDITNNEWISCQEFFNYTCAYCNKTLNEQYEQNGQQFHKEHVDDNGYNDVRNCVPACSNCNSVKQNRTIDELINNNIITNFTNENYDKIKLWCEEKYKEYIENKPPYRITRKQNNNSNTYYFELWTVDEKRNMIKCIATAPKKAGLKQYIKLYFDITA